MQQIVPACVHPPCFKLTWQWPLGSTLEWHLCGPDGCCREVITGLVILGSAKAFSNCTETMYSVLIVSKLS